jgi:hypothetical protein
MAFTAFGVVTACCISYLNLFSCVEVWMCPAETGLNFSSNGNCGTPVDS